MTDKRELLSLVVFSGICAFLYDHFLYAPYVSHMLFLWRWAITTLYTLAVILIFKALARRS